MFVNDLYNFQYSKNIPINLRRKFFSFTRNEAISNYLKKMREFINDFIACTNEILSMINDLIKFIKNLYQKLGQLLQELC